MELNKRIEDVKNLLDMRINVLKNTLSDFAPEHFKTHGKNIEKAKIIFCEKLLLEKMHSTQIEMELSMDWEAYHKLTDTITEQKEFISAIEKL